MSSTNDSVYKLFISYLSVLYLHEHTFVKHKNTHSKNALHKVLYHIWQKQSKFKVCLINIVDISYFLLFFLNCNMKPTVSHKYTIYNLLQHVQVDYINQRQYCIIICIFIVNIVWSVILVLQLYLFTDSI